MHLVAPLMICLDAACNRSVVRAAIGDLLRIELPEDAAAGRRWALPDPLPTQLRLVLDKTASFEHATYDGSARRLEFRVVAQGPFSLSLVTSRDWHASPSTFFVFIEAFDDDANNVPGPESGRE